MEEQILESPPPPPIEYAGKWIAYNSARTEIIASGSTWDEVREAADELGEHNPLCLRVPRGFRVAGKEYV